MAGYPGKGGVTGKENKKVAENILNIEGDGTRSVVVATVSKLIEERW